jgi:hypothetical protein
MVAFVLPWARIDLREPTGARPFGQAAKEQRLLGGLTQQLGKVTVSVRRGAETVTGDLPTPSDIPKQVSGAQIPQMASQQDVQVAVALIELFTKERQHMRLKSYAVYLVPGIALLCGVLLTFLGRLPGVAIGSALCCAGIAGVGFWKLLTTNTQTLFVAITIGSGLWISLWSYVGLAVAGGLYGLIGRARA